VLLVGSYRIVVVNLMQKAQEEIRRSQRTVSISQQTNNVHYDVEIDFLSRFQTTIDDFDTKHVHKN